MNIYSIMQKQLRPTAVALGYFDGVHKGHRKVISKTVSLKKQGLIPTVFTFLQNPKSVIFDIKIKLITTQKEKETEFAKLGIEELYTVDFCSIKNLTAKDFVEKILKNQLNAKAVVCGFNYHFGAGGTADAEDLKKICHGYGIKTYVIRPVLYQAKPISSTRVREALAKNDSQTAHNMLIK